MSNPNKRKGSSFEQQVVDYLHPSFPYVERRVQGGSNDRGDIGGIPGLVLECKNVKRMELAAWMDELQAEKENARAGTGAVVVKRRNCGVGRSYVVMELQDYVNLIL